MILHHIVSLKFEVCGSAGDDLLMMERRGNETNPALRDVLVCTHNIVTASCSNIQRNKPILKKILNSMITIIINYNSSFFGIWKFLPKTQTDVFSLFLHSIFARNATF